MKIKSIKTEEEYNQALKQIDKLFDASKGSEDAKELALLVSCVNKYEEKNYPIDKPDTAEYIKIRIEEERAC